jgi:hypothetical protein
MYTNVSDFTLVLSDFLKDFPVLLQKPTVDQMFSPQILTGSPAPKALLGNGRGVYDCTLANGMKDPERELLQVEESWKAWA